MAVAVTAVNDEATLTEAMTPAAVAAATVVVASTAAAQFREWLSSVLPTKSVSDIETLASAFEKEDLRSIEGLGNL